MHNNTHFFALKCSVEISTYQAAVSYCFDTRLIGGDYTVINIHEDFASESAARLKLYEEMIKWD